MNRISISLERRFLADTVALYLFDRSRANFQGIVGVAAPIVFHDQKLEEAIPSDPAIEISLETAQSLLDELIVSASARRKKGRPERSRRPSLT